MWEALAARVDVLVASAGTPEQGAPRAGFASSFRSTCLLLKAYAAAGCLPRHSAILARLLADCGAAARGETPTLTSWGGAGDAAVLLRVALLVGPPRNDGTPLAVAVQGLVDGVCVRLGTPDKHGLPGGAAGRVARSLLSDLTRCAEGGWGGVDAGCAALRSALLEGGWRADRDANPTPPPSQSRALLRAWGTK